MSDHWTIITKEGMVIGTFSSKDVALRYVEKYRAEHQDTDRVAPLLAPVVGDLCHDCGRFHSNRPSETTEALTAAREAAGYGK